MKNLLFIFLMIYLSCGINYFLLKNESQVTEVKKILNDLEWEITSIDTFYGLTRRNILKYRIMYKPKKIKKEKHDSISNEIKRIFELD